jgi:hypothetical protein
MGDETRLVVRPLVRWFKEQKADWKVRPPKHETAERGWDIVARRKNYDLLIEAKYMAGPSISSFAGLVSAPMADRKYPSSSYGVCGAIGIEPTRNIYQVLFDIMARNLRFWKHYGVDFRMKYIFFVQDRKVMKMPFADFLSIAKLYAASAKGKTLKQRRQIAKNLLTSGPSR